MIRRFIYKSFIQFTHHSLLTFIVYLLINQFTYTYKSFIQFTYIYSLLILINQFILIFINLSSSLLITCLICVHSNTPINMKSSVNSIKKISYGNMASKNSLQKQKIVKKKKGPCTACCGSPQCWAPWSPLACCCCCCCCCCVCACVCVSYIHTYIHTYIYTYTNKRARAHTHTQTHTQKHTHTHDIYLLKFIDM